MTPQKPVGDADIEAAVRAKLPWLLERSRSRAAAASENTVSGRLRRAVAAMKQPYEQVCQATGTPFKTWPTSWPAANCHPMPSIGWRPRERSREGRFRGASPKGQPSKLQPPPVGRSGYDIG